MKSIKLLRKTAKQQASLKAILSKHEEWKGSYWWTPPAEAKQRRDKEFKVECKFNTTGGVVKVIQELSCSCKKYSYSCDIKIDGRRSNIKTVEKLINN